MRSSSTPRLANHAATGSALVIMGTLLMSAR
jgi:hypothetical protein